MTQLFMRRPDLVDLPQVPVPPAGYAIQQVKPVTSPDRDLEPLAALMRDAFADDAWTAERVRTALVDAPDVKSVFVIEHEGVPVATASARLVPELYPHSGYLHWVAVSPGHRGKGLGRTISLTVLHEFQRLGCTDAVLETDDNRLAAIHIYQELGFQPVHTHESHLERWAIIAANLLAAANL